MIRNVLDKDGNIIGQLNLPDNTPEEVWEQKLAEYQAVPIQVIADVTPRQIRQALIMSGISLQQIEDALNSLEEPTRSLARVEWEYSISFQRHRPLVAAVAATLGWNDSQLDALWELAGKL